MTARPLIVLDVDDTLYLERDYVQSGFYAVDEYIQAELSVPGFFDLAWQRFSAGERGRIFDSVFGSTPELAPHMAHIPDLVRIYRTHAPTIQLLPDAYEFIRRHSQQINFAVVTDGPAQSQHAKIKALELYRWIETFIVTADHASHWAKPSETAFKFLQEKYSVSPSDCMYIGDNPQKDFAGPSRLGWRTLRVRRPGGLWYNLDLDGGADTTVESLWDV